MKNLAQRFLAYATGIFALLLVVASAVSALTYTALHHSETLQNLATSTLSGIGMAVGGLIGTALTMRFKTSRDYLKKIVDGLR